jgi:GC-rich sequence DNA-binding factor
MSTDDEENQSDINLFSTQKRKRIKKTKKFDSFLEFFFILEEILNEAEHVLDDVSDEYSQYKNVKIIFEQWKYQQNESYTEAFIEICLPKVFSPLIRKEMIDWRPFEVII